MDRRAFVTDLGAVLAAPLTAAAQPAAKANQAADASAKALKGDDRKPLMSDCLEADKRS